MPVLPSYVRELVRDWRRAGHLTNARFQLAHPVQARFDFAARQFFRFDDVTNLIQRCRRNGNDVIKLRYFALVLVVFVQIEIGSHVFDKLENK